MNEQRVWSLSLGRWGPVHVRVHMFFLLFAALTLYLGWHYADKHADQAMPWMGALFLLILLVSVVLHEFGHYWAAVRLGGGTDQIILGPVGGLVPARVPYEPRSELVAIVAGPLVNLIVVLVSLAGLMAYEQAYVPDPPTELSGLLNPLHPSALDTQPDHGPTTGLKLAIWINWVLFLVNWIPAFPFDGGRALLAFFAIVPQARGGYRPVQIVSAIAKAAALGLLVVAWFVRDEPGPSPPVPIWFALVLLSIFVFFSARVEENQQETGELGDELFGYDFSQGYASLEPAEQPGAPSRGPLYQWRERRREERLRRQRAREAEDDRRMDEVLARLYQTGMEKLSAEDRALLIRVSARYRSRERK